MKDAYRDELAAALARSGAYRGLPLCAEHHEDDAIRGKQK